MPHFETIAHAPSCTAGILPAFFFVFVARFFVSVVPLPCLAPRWHLKIIRSFC
jgi:hypothetical protein